MRARTSLAAVAVGSRMWGALTRVKPAAARCAQDALTASSVTGVPPRATGNVATSALRVDSSHYHAGKRIDRAGVRPFPRDGDRDRGRSPWATAVGR
jgi:hypothetical protein